LHARSIKGLKKFCVNAASHNGYFLCRETTFQNLLGCCIGNSDDSISEPERKPDWRCYAPMEHRLQLQPFCNQQRRQSTLSAVDMNQQFVTEGLLPLLEDLQPLGKLPPSEQIVFTAQVESLQHNLPLHSLRKH